MDPRVGAGLPRWVHRSLPRRQLASELRALAPGAGPSMDYLDKRERRGALAGSWPSVSALRRPERRFSRRR